MASTIAGVRRARTLMVCAAVCAAAAVSVPATPAVAASSGHRVVGGPRSVLGRRDARRTASSTGGNLVDRGGPILSAAHLYAIWWGNAGAWPGDTNAGMTNLLTSFGGSSYLKIAGQYMRGAPLATTFARSFSDPSAPPTRSPSTTTIANEIQRVLAANAVAVDPSGIYFVFTSTFPRAASYCAWHSGATVNGVRIAQAYMPNTTGIAGCDPGNLYSANSYSQGTRSLANVTAHELMEAVTDQLPGGTTTAWVDNAGAEIGDKCAWSFSGPVTVGSTSWQLQREWSNAVSGCVQQ